MKKVLIVVVALFALASGRVALAALGDACLTDGNCNPPDGPATQHCGCAQGATPAPPSGPSACGELDILGSFGGPSVLEVSGCADASGADGCISVAETVDLSAAGPTECDSAADAACASCGCGVCLANGPE